MIRRGLGRILSAESRREMLTVRTLEDPTQGYGLGLSLQRTEDGTRFAGDGGSVAGYNAYMIFDPASKIGVVLLRNYNWGATNLGMPLQDYWPSWSAARSYRSRIECLETTSQ
ncbi:MAG: serine hydrolase [Gemmatimonadales bacterium]